MGVTNQFLWGALWLAAWSIGVFLLRFWIESRERLFLLFAMAFGVLGAHWAGLALSAAGAETRHYWFLLRLAACALIILGVVDKNRRGPA